MAIAVGKDILETDFSRIEKQLDNLQELALLVRGKAWAIKTQPQPRCEDPTKRPQPGDAASILLEKIDTITSIVIDTRDSLQAFI